MNYVRIVEKKDMLAGTYFEIQTRVLFFFWRSITTFTGDRPITFKSVAECERFLAYHPIKPRGRTVAVYSVKK